MAHWLFKSEPGTWSWDDQVKAGRKGTEWDGVRNYQARNVMREMTVGDRGFFYHSGEAKEIVGIVEVAKAIHPDSTDDSGTWECVDVRAVKALPRPVPLADVKAHPALAEMALVKNSRLSVQPVTDAEWQVVLDLAGAG
jgi:predicted RNA-binding protein with PUA-like domain